MEKGTQGAIDKWQDSWQFGVAMELDIWNWGETRNKVQRAVHAKKEIENQQILLLKSIELEVKSAFLNLQTAKKQIESIKKSMETAEENLRITKILYSEGMTTTTEVLDAHTDLAVVLNNYYQSLYDYQIAYAGLEKAAGVLIARSKK
ncbi:MAG: TolC family protein [Candidatus Ratteibacteria bacterium]